MAAKKRDKEADDQEISIRPMHNSAKKKLAVPDDLERPALDDRSTVFTESKQGLLNIGIQKKLSLLLIPCALVIIALLVALNIPTAFEPPLVLPLMNTLFLGIIPIVIAYVTFKVYTKNGSASVLLIGSGILIFGLGSIVAGWVNPLIGGPNMTVTLHNTCACIGSILILAGAVISHAPAKSGRATGNTGTIAAAYTAIVVFVTIFSLATLQGMIPPFFVPGSGPTVLRQVILENATALFALSSVLFMVTYRKGRSDFFFWYSVALALIAIGLLAVFVQPSVGSLIGWVGRSAQYIGFVFALYAVLIARKTATAKGLPVEDVIGSFFVDAEQNYRQLVETTTDAIVTIDDNYRVLLWNSAAERMFGYPRDDAFGASFLKLVIDDPYIAVIKNYEQDIFGHDIQALTPEPVEIVGKRKGGALFPVELTVSRRWQEGRLIQTCILRDITERKQAKERADHLASFPHLTPILLLEVDAHGSILYANPAIRHVLKEMGEDDFHIFIPQDIRDRLDGTVIKEFYHEVRENRIHDRVFQIKIYFTPEFSSIRFYANDITDRKVAEDALRKANENLEIKVKKRTAQLSDANRDLVAEAAERKKTDERLQESENRFRKIFENSPLGMTLVTPDFHFFEANPGWISMTGYSEEELRNLTFKDITHPDHLAGDIEHIQDLVAGKIPFYATEKRYIRKDGSIIWGLISVTPIRDSDGKTLYFATQIENITERKQAEQALREAHDRFEATIASLNEAIFLVDPVTRLITECNDATTRIFGYSHEELVGRQTGFLHVDPAHLEQFGREAMATYEDPGYYTREFEMRRKDGSVFPTEHFVRPIRDPDGRILYVVSVVRDITERKVAEVALKESETSYRGLFNTLRQAIYIIGADGTFIDVNEGAVAMYGYSRAEFIGRTTEFLAAPGRNDPSAMMEYIRKAFAGESQSFEFWAMRKGGEYFPKDVFFYKGTYFGKDVVIAICSDITKRKEAEEALRESEAHLRQITDTITSVFYIHDRVSNKFISVSPAYEQIWKRSCQSLIDNPYSFLEAVHPDDLPRVQESIRKELEEGKYVDTDYRIIQPDGNVRWIRSRNFPIVNETGKTIRVAGIAEDISDLKRADLSVKASKEYAETLIQTANAMVIGLDLNGTINIFNEAAEKITGYTAAELSGRNWFEVIVPKVQYPRVWEEFNRLLAGGLPKYFENPILTKSGEERYIVWKNSEIRNNEQTVGTISFGIDITERKRAEDALRVSEEKFRLISESSPDHIFIQDRDLRYIWVLNPQLGLTPEDMIGKTDYDILSKQDADQLTPVKRQVLETGKTIHYETSLSSSLGETEYFEGVYLPKYDNEGQIDGMLGYFRNITERKQNEQTILHALAEKEVLLREVHHRVKNNLAGILALIELQISSLSDPKQIAQFKDLEKRIRSMALVHDSLSRTKDLARINVASYTENLTSHLLPAYGTEGKVRCRIEMGDITLPIETATPCGLVMNEIVTNSLKYAFPKTFSCEEIRGEPCTITLTLHRDGNDYLLGIADNGIGMPEVIDVKMSHTLGRFLIRFIVEHQLGGSIGMSTARGTAYTIRFPAPAVKEGSTDEKM